MGYLETPYPYTPLRLAFFVDGKAYFHSIEGAGLNTPIRRDSKLYCVDTNTGKMLWSLTAHNGLAGTTTPIITDGRIIYLDNHDNQIYCLGKGTSGTTVTAPDTTIPLGEEVLIKGTVTDQTNSGRYNIAGSLDFTLKGTPAISDESMDEWMEYVFHQRPKPKDAKGVEVIITTLDPNGNTYELGRTTSDTNGNFGCVVEPSIAGKYKIIATFEGSKSYFSSTATTYLWIEEVPSPTQPIEPEPTPEPSAPLISTEVAIIATVAVVAVIGIVAYWMLKKRK